MSIFAINGTPYDVGVILVVRKASIDVDDLGVTMDGTKHYEAYGTYYDYEITINTRGMNVAEYDTLYEVLTAPVAYQSITVPYGQTDITFNARLKVANDSMVFNHTNKRKWSSLKITAEAISPQRTVE